MKNVDKKGEYLNGNQNTQKLVVGQSMQMRPHDY